MLPFSRLARPAQIEHGWTSAVLNNRSVWAASAGLLALQGLGTLCLQWQGGPPPYEATNADFLYGRSIILLFFIFLSIQYDSLLGLCLGIYNTLLLVTLLRYSSVWKRGPSKRQVLIHGSNLMAIVGMRVLLGYLFSRSTGWAVPSLFFNDAIHETTYGFAQAILYRAAGQAFGVFVVEEQVSPFKSPWFLFFLWLPNVIRGPIFFWSFSTVSITGIHALWVLLTEGKGKSYAGGSVDELTYPSDQTHSKLSRLTATIQKYLIFAVIFLSISYAHSMIYHYGHRLHVKKISDLPEPTLVDFLILSYPRPGSASSSILSSTLDTYLPHLGDRFTASVFTTASLEAHAAFGQAKAEAALKQISKLDFFQDADPTKFPGLVDVVPGSLPTQQTVDLYSALSWMEKKISESVDSSARSRYIGIMEDDFEWCPGSWDELKAVIYEVAKYEQTQQRDPLCGIFIATGGSGLLIRPAVFPLLRRALEEYGTKLNPDILIQYCLAGELELCSQCRLAASRRMILRHTGSAASTYANRTYPEDRWQCGWRQPFNGRIGIFVP